MGLGLGLESGLMKSKSLLSDSDLEFANLPKVKAFLESIGRNSIKSKTSYFTGLRHLSNFVIRNYPGKNYDCSTILEPLLNNEINVYELLDSFISNILEERKGITPKSLSLYVSTIRSYFAYYDIDVLPSKFKRKVKMPKLYREDEEPVDASDIRKILLACNNRRLKTVLLFLASGAMRVSECLAIRNRDIDFTVKPTKVRLRKEFSKTRVGRDVYVSDEATDYLKQWLDWKYKNPDRQRKFNDEDLVFTVSESKDPKSIYNKVWYEFDRLLTIVKMDQKKEQGLNHRKKITIHTLRRHAKTIISEQAGQDYSEFFLGHAKSPYWTMKEEKRREIYAARIMKYLTFLDYSTLETTGKNIEAKLNEKEMEIQLLRQRDLRHETEMEQIRNQIVRMDQQVSKSEILMSEINKKLLPMAMVDEKTKAELDKIDLSTVDKMVKEITKKNNN